MRADRDKWGRPQAGMRGQLVPAETDEAEGRRKGRLSPLVGRVHFPTVIPWTVLQSPQYNVPLLPYLQSSDFPG